MLSYLLILETEEEKKTFQEIYEKNYLKMYHVAFKMLGQQADAENAVHEAFLSLAEKYQKYSALSCSEMSGLCVTIVKHKSIDYIRRQKHLSDEEVENLVLYNENEEYNPEEKTMHEIESEELHKVMMQLPETMKIVLDLKFYYEYSNSEIAQILGTTTKNVEMRLYRAKQKMKELLEHGI